MSRCQQVSRPMAQCLRPVQVSAPPMAAAVRAAFSSSARRRDEQITTTKDTTTPTTDAVVPPPPSQESGIGGGAAPQSSSIDLISIKLEPHVTRTWTAPVGSRRKRAAVRTSQNIPFEQLPYQCFQEARKILQADREEKLREIVRETARIKGLEARDASELKGGEQDKQNRLRSLRKYVEYLKIQADMNDPEVKRRFEDGLGDMNKPIYRHLAERRWRGYPYRLITQRISQFNIVPDLLPKFSPTVDVQLFFRGRKFGPGEIVDSLISEKAPSLHVQCFDRGERLVTVAVVDSDVPLVEKDGFARRCHFLAANVRLSPTQPVLALGHLGDKAKTLAIPWLPAFAQKGSPYHRLSVFVLEQKEGQTIDVEALRKAYGGGKRDGGLGSSSSSFSIKSLRDKFPLEPVGFTLFRALWDDHTADVMARHGIPGADVELRRTRVHSLKEPRKARGWEAKHQGPKYRHLWKYTHRIATPKRKFVR